MSVSEAVATAGAFWMRSKRLSWLRPVRSALWPRASSAVSAVMTRRSAGEGGDRRQRQGGDGGEAGGERRDDAVRGPGRRGGQVVGLRPVGEEEEGVQVLHVARRAGSARRAVGVGARHAAGVQFLHPLLGALVEHLQLPELDGIGGARLGARRLQPALQTVVAEGALVRL